MENLSLFCQWFIFIYYFILELIAKGGKDAEDIKEIEWHEHKVIRYGRRYERY